METFLFILAIVLPLCLLTAVYRLNTVFSNMQRRTDAAFFTDKALFWLNSSGKWLTIFGGIATFPLVMGLILDSGHSIKWIVNLGIAGCLSMILAASLLIPTLMGLGITRRIQCKLLFGAIQRVLMNPARQLIFKKMAVWWCAGTLLTLLMMFTPVIEQLVSGVVYVIGFILVTRLGLTDRIKKDFEAKWGGSAYNYNTGKWDDGYREGGLY